MGFFWICLLIFSGAFYAAFVHGDLLAKLISGKLGKTVAPWSIAAAVVCAAFVTLVLLGSTGSSVALLYQQSTFLNDTMVPLGLSPEQIRTDEWVVFTPMAIGQQNHQPPFPIVNHNLGNDGQNMLVVGMTGVPVKHVTQFAKPATWGFYFLDLRRALSWYWWFPVFGCLLALWWLFGFLFRGRWRLGFALSLLFCLSPYCVAWSNWPDYVLFFPAIALCIVMTLLLRDSTYLQAASLGVALGLSIAGFVLVLYPPWQVTLGYLFLLILAALVARDRTILRVRPTVIISVLIATVVSGALLLAWWVDAKAAIQAMMNTVYPGMRDLTGGGITMSYFLRGYTDITSLYRLEGYLNQSEIASFNYLLLPIIVAVGLRFRILRNSYHIPLAITIYATFSMLFAFHGVSHLVARLTLWKVVNVIRTDLALGLAYILLCGFVLARDTPERERSTGEVTRLLIYMVSFVWVIITCYFLSQLPKGVYAGMPNGVALGMLLVVFVSGVWLMSSDAKKFLSISLATCVAASVPFNPLSLAPKTVGIAPEICLILNRAHSNGRLGRVLVLQSHSQAQVQAMALISAGVPTIDGVFFYPQPNLWHHLGIGNTLPSAVNRYQHLIFVVGSDNDTNAFRIENPQPDIVEVIINPHSFNFAFTEADIVLAPAELNDRLSSNPGLRLARSDNGWSWFDVSRPVTSGSTSGATINVEPDLHPTCGGRDRPDPVQWFESSYSRPCTC